MLISDSFLQRTKHRYNNPRNLSTRVNLSDMSEEMRLRPPYMVQEEDILFSNGTRNGHQQNFKPPSKRM